MLTNLHRCVRLLTCNKRAFGDQAKAALPSFLTAQEIKEKVPPEEYAKLQGEVVRLEKEALLHHQIRLAALEKQLNTSQKERICKIDSLLQSLNESEAEYIRFRLLALAEGQATS